MGGDNCEVKVCHDPTFRLSPRTAKSESVGTHCPSRQLGMLPGGTDSTLPYGRVMAKAARVLAGLNRDGWIETRAPARTGSWSKATSSGSGPTMMVWTWAARLWPA